MGLELGLQSASPSCFSEFIQYSYLNYTRKQGICQFSFKEISRKNLSEALARFGVRRLGAAFVLDGLPSRPVNFFGGQDVREPAGQAGFP